MFRSYSGKVATNRRSNKVLSVRKPKSWKEENYIVQQLPDKGEQTVEFQSKLSDV